MTKKSKFGRSSISEINVDIRHRDRSHKALSLHAPHRGQGHNEDYCFFAFMQVRITLHAIRNYAYFADLIT